MRTKVVSSDAPGFERELHLAADILKRGGIVAFPTETVYGLGADGLNAAAVRLIYEAKGRPTDNPSILHVSCKEDALKLWDPVPQHAELLMDCFWPGPLTIIGKRASHIPDAVTGGLDTVAVRCPSDPIANRLIELAGVPIAAPSANLSGKPSPTGAAHVIEDLFGKVPMIIDGGNCGYGVESTVISLADRPVLLRPGIITMEQLSAVIGEVYLAPSILQPLQSGEKAASPGMKYKHYAPNADVFVVTGEPEKAADLCRTMYHRYTNEGKRCEIGATVQTGGYYVNERYTVLGDRNDPGTLCASLFAKLREMDTRADVILAEGIEPKSAGLAYMNRLLRAAGFKVLKAE